jgi:lipopolysaccharide biosynthesis glycosyltransferase
VAHSAAMLHSAITNGGSQVVVAHYLHGPGFPNDAERKLCGMFERHSAEIVFHEIPDRWITRLPVNAPFGPAMWYRIFLPELVDGAQRLLYLDVDTIVVSRIDELWSLDLSESYLAAVTNVCVDPNEHHPLELGMDPRRYFNSGVLLLNLELMRRDEFSSMLIDRVTRRRVPLTWPDQDALNLTAASTRLELHPRWNCMNTLVARFGSAIEMFGEQVVADAVEMPAIRHFEGPAYNKPWHVLHGRAGQRMYRKHRRATPWPEYRLEEDTRRNRVKRLIMDARNHGRSIAPRTGARS